MKNIIYLFSALLVSGAIFLVSCEKEEGSVSMTETITCDDEVAAYFDDLLAEIDDLTYTDVQLKSGEVLSDHQAGTRTVVTAFSADTIIHTISYGAFVHPNSPNGRVKNGKVIIRVVGRPRQTTFWREISLKDFTVNDNEILGVKTITKTDDYRFTITLSDGMVRFADGTTYTRAFSRTRTQVAGMNTPFFIWDDEFISEGQASGINQLGESYTHTITNPLLNRRNCRWIVQGSITFEVSDVTALLYYGDGACDREASLTVKGKTTVIDLRPGQD